MNTAMVVVARHMAKRMIAAAAVVMDTKAARMIAVVVVANTRVAQMIAGPA